MIVKYPTGLYETVLPLQPSDSGNVTWTISNSIPPRSIGIFSKLPKSKYVHARFQKFYDDLARRKIRGALVLTSTQSIRVDFMSSKKLFEPGQVLEFSDGSVDGSVNSQLTPDDIIIQHDTNILDLADLGLSETDISDLSDRSYIKKLEIERQLTQSKLELDVINASIVENQKRINEAEKALKALLVILEVGDPILGQVTNTKNAAEVTKDTLVDSYNTKSIEIDALYNKLLNLAQLVR